MSPKILKSNLFTPNDFGLLAEAQSNDLGICSIPHEWLMRELAHYGVVLLRGFAVNLESFSDFIKNNSRRVTADPARKASSENAQLIDAGDVEMGLHIENGTMPFLPEAQWLYCEKAASLGSKTTVCDGLIAIDNLSVKTVSKFTERRIQFSRMLTETVWKKYLSMELEVPLNEIDTTHLRKVSEMFENQRYRLNTDGSVYSRYSTYAINFTKFSKEKKAFANSILGPSVNHDPPRITWEDGSMISPSIFDEISDVTEGVTEEIPWIDGDVVVIDNTRVMHGRRKVIDKNRRIYGGQSYLGYRTGP